MSVPQLLMVGHHPPAGVGAGGQATQFRIVLDAVQAKGLAHTVISLFPRSHTGKPTVQRAIELLSVIGRYSWEVALRESSVYLSIAQSRQGFARDAAMIWAARCFGRRIVCHLNEGSYDQFYSGQGRLLKAIIRVTLKQTDKIIVVSPSLRSMFDFEPRLASKLVVIPNPTPPHPPALAPKSLSSGRSFRLLYLSLLIESKGYLDVLRAVAIAVNDLGLPVEAHFAGPFATNSSDDVSVTSKAQAETQFRSLIAEFGLTEHVRYHGSVFGVDKERLLKEADALCLPTAFDREAQPLCILEGMSYGCPVIATSHRAIPDMVDDGKTGFLVPYGEPTAIAQAVQELLADPDRYQAMSAAAMHRAAAFDPHQHVHDILATVTGAVSAEAPQRAAS